jgi:hypothetical protein
VRHVALETSVLLKTEELSIESSRSNWVDLTNHQSEHDIVLFRKTGQEMGDELVIAKRNTRCCKFICKLRHLGIVMRNRELIFLGSGQSYPCINRTNTCLR